MRIGRQNAQVARPCDRLAAIGHLQLAQYIADVLLDRVRGNVERVCNLAIRDALRHEL